MSPDAVATKALYVSSRHL